MAVAIMISTFGCNNGLILAGARVYYAMARDGLFFKATGKLNTRSVPAVGLVLQCVWTCLLVLPRTRSARRTWPAQLDAAASSNMATSTATCSTTSSSPCSSFTC